MNYQLKIIRTKIQKDRISERQNNKKRKDRKTKIKRGNKQESEGLWRRRRTEKENEEPGQKDKKIQIRKGNAQDSEGFQANCNRGERSIKTIAWLDEKIKKNHWKQWYGGWKSFNGDGWVTQEPSKNHWCQCFFFAKKTLPSYRPQKWPLFTFKFQWTIKMINLILTRTEGKKDRKTSSLVQSCPQY